MKNKGFNFLGVEEDARWLRDLANGASVVGSIITEEDKEKFSKIQVIVEEFVK